MPFFLRHSHGKIDTEITAFIKVAGSLLRNDRFAARNQQAVDTQRFIKNITLIPLEGSKGTQQLQVILLGDLVYLVHHFLGIDAVRFIRLRDIHGVFLRRCQQCSIRVIAFQEGKPFLVGKIGAASFQSVQGEDLPGNLRTFHPLSRFIEMGRDLHISLRDL